MDPLTHALVGTGVASLTGDKFSLANPIHMGAVLGALAPDIDIVLQLYGDVPYLTHHRGSSHSIPGVLVTSAVIAFVLWLVLGGAHPGMIFVWTVLGAVSHILLDILNSYGAKILWPFSQKKYSLNLLVLADPVIITLFAGVILWPGTPRAVVETVFWLAMVYLGIRFYMRQSVHRRLWQKYEAEGVKRVVVMPAVVSLWNWSFLVETQEAYIVGEVRCFSLHMGIEKILDKKPKNTLIQQALQSKLGQVFQNFTPYFHIFDCVEDGRHVVKFYDLRYFFREDFLHTATVFFDEKNKIIDAVFHPYHKNRKVRVMG